jgi:hypothetical protein
MESRDGVCDDSVDDDDLMTPTSVHAHVWAAVDCVHANERAVGVDSAAALCFSV